MKTRYLINTDPAVIDAEKCVGCGICTDVCPHLLISMKNNKAVIEEPERCISCGGCMKNCPSKAIHVNTGVGCASAVFNTILGRKVSDSSCSCVIETPENKEKPSCCSTKKSGCC